MIKKLTLQDDSRILCGKDYMLALRYVQQTINQLVDAVNELQATISKMEKVEPAENVQDKFAEQRKWIGYLCWFWDDKYDLKTAGVLEDITTIEEEFHYAKKDTCTVWKHCEPVKPDDDIIYCRE